MHPESTGLLRAAAGTQALIAAGSLTVGLTDRAWAYPFRLPSPGLAKQLLYWVGATSAGNVDVGIYNSQGNAVVSSGATAMSATVNTIQLFNITDTWLPAGDYYLAFRLTNATATCFGVLTTDELAAPTWAQYEDADGSGALPATLIPVASTESSYGVYVIGIVFASIF